LRADRAAGERMLPPMNPRLLLLPILGVAALVGCSPTSDFKRLCQVSDEVIADPKIPRHFRPQVIDKRFRKGSMLMSGKTKTCIESVWGTAKSPGGMDPDYAYKNLEACARAAGATGWSCRSLEEHYAFKGPPLTGDPGNIDDFE
jgi:hypothetical protein